jgi:YVTN family beta-propeller protein
VNNANGKFAYITIGGANVVKVFRRGATPELVATIRVGSLPHGIWPSGDGSRVYVALENGEQAAAIDTLTNKVIANIPIGQTTQALVYVPGAVPNGAGTDNLMSLGEAGNTARLHLEAGGTVLPDAQASVAVNSLGLLDLVQIAAAGLAPKSQYRVYLAESNHAPFGKLEALAILNTCAWRLWWRRSAVRKIPHRYRHERHVAGGIATGQCITSSLTRRNHDNATPATSIYA